MNVIVKILWVTKLKQNKIGKKENGYKNLKDKLSTVLTTDRQKTFLKNRMAGLNNRQAAIQAGYAPSSASIMAKKLTDKLACNRAFIEECERQGLTIHAIIKELKRGVTRAMHPGNPLQPDNFNRKGYLDIALKLFGAYPPIKMELDERRIEIQITPETLERIEKLKGKEAFIKLLSEEETEENYPSKNDAPF
jgi:hypothetical protein